MPKKLTKDFIEQARKVHGDKYDYSKVEYVTNRKNVIIICSKHGEFRQLPTHHLKGHGCSKCAWEESGYNRRKKVETFILESQKIHNNKYDYSKVEYKNAKTNVCIICHEKDEDGDEHGEFWQTPSNHLKGQGCRRCSGKYKPTSENIIEKFRNVHKNKYNYSIVKYKNLRTKICIICHEKDENGVEHGIFKQTPETHLRGYGCPKCSRNYRPTTEEVIEKFRNVHGNKYDYSGVVYETALKKVCIICPEHGEFRQTPNNHLKGHGCPGCYGNKQSNNEEFIERTKNVHGNKYDYSKVKYKNAVTKVTIICPEHGEFRQRPDHHLKGVGCPKCNSSRLEKKVVDFLDNHSLKYEREYKFDWLRNKQPLKLDFYLLDYNIAIECQGEQHYKPIEVFGGEDALKKTQKLDKLKKELCEKHNLPLHYINYYDSMEDIENKLKQILQL